MTSRSVPVTSDPQPEPRSSRKESTLPLRAKANSISSTTTATSDTGCDEPHTPGDHPRIQVARKAAFSAKIDTSFESFNQNVAQTSRPEIFIQDFGGLFYGQEEISRLPEIPEPSQHLIKRDPSQDRDSPQSQHAGEHLVSIRGGLLTTPQEPALPRLASVISDGGEQERKKQKPKRLTDYKRSKLPSLSKASSGYGYDGYDGGLVTRLAAALKSSRGITGSVKTEQFLPLDQLDDILTESAIVRELLEKVQKTRIPRYSDDDVELIPGSEGTLAYLKDLAKTICREDVVERNGRRLIQSYRKIFATLIFVDEPFAIQHFINEVSDIDLPLTIQRDYPHPGWIDPRRKDDPDVPLRCFEGWQYISRTNFVQYQWRVLAPYFTHDEHGCIKHFELQECHVFPCVEEQSTDGSVTNHADVGGFGTIYMVNIHPEQHNFHRLGVRDLGFAIKKLKQQDEQNRKAFEREVKALRKFSENVEHDHVVSLLATYEQFGEFHLIFHRADGHLLKFWEENAPKREWKDYIWLARQCDGLADGLLHLHNWSSIKASTFPGRRTQSDSYRYHSASPGQGYFRRKLPSPQGRRARRSEFALFGDNAHNKRRRWSFDTTHGAEVRQECLHVVNRRDRPPSVEGNISLEERRKQFEEKEKHFGRHGDIKPNNILWYRNKANDKGTLKLADFGQAELNSHWSRSKEREVAYSRTYRPPECDAQPRHIRQNYDIWCLGCVYLEFVAWMIGGFKKVNEFTERRLTQDVYCKTDPFFEIDTSDPDKPLARVKPEVTAFINELRNEELCTDLLRDLLELIEQNMLVVDVYVRSDCDKVHDRLEALLEMCECSEDYATKTTRRGVNHVAR